MHRAGPLRGLRTRRHGGCGRVRRVVCVAVAVVMRMAGVSLVPGVMRVLKLACVFPRVRVLAVMGMPGPGVAGLIVRAAGASGGILRVRVMSFVFHATSEDRMFDAGTA
jgi:hypothetical protein